MSDFRPDRSSLRAAAGPLLFLAVLAACGIKMIPTKDAWFTQHYPIMQDFERDLYRALAAPAKAEFQRLFWAARDPRSLEVFRERMSYVLSAFKRENSRQPWNTDRGRVYLLNGPPAAIDIDQNTDWGMRLGQAQTGGVSRSNEDVQANRAEVWTYSFRKQYVKYAFAFVAPNEWRMAPAFEGSRFVGELEEQSRTLTFGILDEAGYRHELEALAKK
ncbi:MAG TPA: GWxTD domain-containing protein [Candidatus Aminicenantes bacterium]|nr:GWxTD domain-containing protein [Candidatus Aminicenantes bacterium]